MKVDDLLFTGVDMASFVGRPIVGFSMDGGGQVTMTVTYTVRYTHDELLAKQEFADAMALHESDSGEIFGGSDDHYFDMPVRTFTPNLFQEIRAWVVPLRAEQLDTESGGEEIYAKVYFRRSSESVSMIIDSEPFPLAV